MKEKAFVLRARDFQGPDQVGAHDYLMIQTLLSALLYHSCSLTPKQRRCNW